MGKRGHLAVVGLSDDLDLRPARERLLQGGARLGAAVADDDADHEDERPVGVWDMRSFRAGT